MSAQTIRPRLTVLDPAQIEAVHDTSLRVLHEVGLRVDDAQARALFETAGARIDDRRVYLPPPVVEWALETAPSTVTVYDRLGQAAFQLGPDQATRFGVGVTTLYYQDPANDTIVPFGREHMALCTRLGHALPAFDVISTVGVIQDVELQQADLLATLDMLANTTKPLVLLVSETARFTNVLDMVAALCPQMHERPFILPYVNPITPLVLGAETTDKMRWSIERGLPLIFSSYGMAGATTPIDTGRVLTLLNAELLAGLVFGQLLQPGMPIVLGMLPAQFDMRHMSSRYGMRSYVLNLACAELMAHYGLPHCGTSGSGIGLGSDLIAAGHQWANHLTSCLGRVGLAPFVGGVLSDMAFSPQLLVYAAEVIEQARRFAEGLTLESPETMLDEISEVGPGGNFLGSERTVQSYRQALYDSPTWSLPPLKQWQAAGSPQTSALLRERTLALLAESRPPEDGKDIQAQGEKIIQKYSGARR